MSSGFEDTKEVLPTVRKFISDFQNKNKNITGKIILSLVYLLNKNC